MAKNDIPGTTSFDSDNIPVVTIPRSFRKSYGNTFLIIAILIAEAIGSYTIVALNYPSMYKWLYGSSPNFGVSYEFSDIVINPAESKGQRFLVCSISLQIRSEDDLANLVQKEFIVKDAINTLLSKKSVDELQSVEGRINLKQEIGIVINSILEDTAIRNVFFTKYVMQ